MGWKRYKDRYSCEAVIIVSHIGLYTNKNLVSSTISKLLFIENLTHCIVFFTEICLQTPLKLFLPKCLLISKDWNICKKNREIEISVPQRISCFENWLFPLDCTHSLVKSGLSILLGTTSALPIVLVLCKFR